jgi:hypothetical protein
MKKIVFLLFCTVVSYAQKDRVAAKEFQDKLNERFAVYEATYKEQGIKVALKTPIDYKYS